MNEKVNEQMDALMGSQKPAEETDWKQKYEESEKARKSAWVEEGRVKKLNAELEAARKELEQLRNSRKGEELTSALSQEERDSIPEEVLNAAAKLVSSGMSRVQAENEERWNRENSRRSEMEKEDFVNRINSRYPGFMDSVSEGGPNASKWRDYVAYNKGSIRDAYATYDFRTISYHIEQFYTNFLGVRVPSGDRDGSAAPDPRASGGGSTGAGTPTSGKVYTQAEFLSLYDLVEEARAKGNYAEMKRLSSEIENAPKENRVR